MPDSAPLAAGRRLRFRAAGYTAPGLDYYALSILLYSYYKIDNFDDNIYNNNNSLRYSKEIELYKIAYYIYYSKENNYFPFLKV